MINSSYTVIKTKKIEETSNFYEIFFGFSRSFSSDWYVSLKSENSELAVMDSEHDSIPVNFRGISSGPQLILNFETEQVDEIYKMFKAAGHKIHLDLRDEPWGQRHFISEDPNGIAIDVIKLIPPSEDFLKLYNHD
jgi:uncharacterized glyoxalase superfamily protein PhnB